MQFESASVYDLTYSLYYSQDEQSETWIGEWAEKRGIRDQLFIATKVNSVYQTPISHVCSSDSQLLVHNQLQAWK